MTLADAIVRPFSRWNLEPYGDEPAHGYFARLVASEQHNSARRYAVELGLNGRDVVPGELLATVMQLPLPEEWRDRLLHATPTMSGGGVVMGGQRFHKRQWSATRRRYCPGCIAEAAYHRCWWDLSSVRVCPFHGVPIRDAAPGGKVLRFWWPHFDADADGNHLGASHGRLPDRSGLESYLVGRMGMGFGPRISSPSLDRFDAGDAIRFCEEVGARLAGTPDPAAGYDLCWRGLSQLSSHLTEWLGREVPETERRRGYVVAFGTPDAGGKPRFRASDIMQSVMKKTLAAMNSPVPRMLTEKDFEAADVGIEALAQRLGVYRRAVTETAGLLGILPQREWYRARVLFTPDEALAIEHAVGGAVSFQEATVLLKLPRLELTSLVKAGLLNPVRGLRRGQRRSVLLFEITGLIEKLRTSIPEAGTAPSISIRTLARRLDVQFGEVAAQAALGRLKGVWRLPGTTGFEGLRVPGQRKKRKDAVIGPIRMSIGSQS